MIIDNGSGQAISQIFTLSFDTGSGSPIGISSPTSGATASGTVAVNTTTSASVSKVKFFVDGVLNATDTSAPFTWSWDSTQTLDGLHTLTAQAYDSSLAFLGASAPVTVTVNNGSVSTGPTDPYEAQ